MIGDVERSVEVVVACVAQGGSFYLRVSPESARELVGDVLEQNGAAGVAMRADPDEKPNQARGPWLALTVGIGAVALFAWSLIS